jgi:hypothetical protein
MFALGCVDGGLWCSLKHTAQTPQTSVHTHKSKHNAGKANYLSLMANTIQTNMVSKVPILYLQTHIKYAYVKHKIRTTVSLRNLLYLQATHCEGTRPSLGLTARF